MAEYITKEAIIEAFEWGDADVVKFILMMNLTWLTNALPSMLFQSKS